jgi:hypothetical protein
VQLLSKAVHGAKSQVRWQKKQDVFLMSKLCTHHAHKSPGPLDALHTILHVQEGIYT